MIPSFRIVAVWQNSLRQVQADIQNSLKPSKRTLEYIIKETGHKADQIAIIGDRLYTDIAVADQSDVTSILVMSGETKSKDVEKVRSNQIS